MNPVYLDLVSSAHAFALIDGVSNYSPTKAQSQEIESYFGEKLTNIVKSGISFMEHFLTGGRQSEEKILWGMMNIFIANRDIARWAKTEGDEHYSHPYVYFIPLAAYIRDIAKKQGRIRQEGLTLRIAV